MSRQAFQILQITVIAALMGSFILAIARRQLISFRYTIGWLGLCAVTFLGALLVPVVEPVAEFLKVDPFTVVGGSAFLILLAICVQLSISISGLQRQLPPRIYECSAGFRNDDADCRWIPERLFANQQHLHHNEYLDGFQQRRECGQHHR